MAIIGFDNQVEQQPEKEISEAEKIKMHNQVEEAQKSLYLSPKRLAEIEADYDEGVVVHDFGDDYHLSDKEREEQNIFYKQFRKLVKCKRKYRKLDEYVECARISLACLNAVAEKNTVYDPEKFKVLVLKGKIVIEGWMYPKYTGRDRKKLNWDYITEFILSDKDPYELVKPRETEFYTEDDLEELSETLFDEGELDKILTVDEDKFFSEVSKSFDPEEDKISDDSTIALVNTDKENKRLLKFAPELLDVAKDIRRELKSSSQLNRYISDIHLDDLQRISEYDAKMSFASKSDIPEFTGDILNNDDYERYMHQLDEYERTQIKHNYCGKMRTEEEIQEIQLKEALESAGWNIRVLYDNEEKRRKLERARKADKKREEKLRKQLTAVQNRSKRRMSDYDNGGFCKKKKKHSKGKKKKKGDD